VGLFRKLLGRRPDAAPVDPLAALAAAVAGLDDDPTDTAARLLAVGRAHAARFALGGPDHAVYRAAVERATGGPTTPSDAVAVVRFDDLAEDLPFAIDVVARARAESAPYLLVRADDVRGAATSAGGELAALARLEADPALGMVAFGDDFLIRTALVRDLPAEPPAADAHDSAPIEDLFALLSEAGRGWDVVAS